MAAMIMSSCGAKYTPLTDEQKTAVTNTALAIENLNEMLLSMVDEMKRLSAAADDIYSNSVELLKEADSSQV